jgi:predicted kinase
MELLILRGISGAGKNHYIEHELSGRSPFVVSADDFFMEQGVYKFNALKLGEAHGACFRQAIEAAQAKVKLLVVNNTTTSIAEIAPYAALGQAYGYDTVIRTLRCPPEVAVARGQHGVSLSGAERMARNLDKGTAELPPWWSHELLEWDQAQMRYR